MSPFTIHSKDTAPADSHGVMDSYASKFGFVPNLIGVMAASPVTVQGYAQLYGLLGETDFTPAEQQLLFLTISRTNGCTYCVAAHTKAGSMMGLDDATITAVRDDRPILDPKLAALSQFAHKVVEKRGFVSRDDVNDFLTAGYTSAQILEVILAVATKTISNYINHIAETPLDPPYQATAWKARSQAA